MSGECYCAGAHPEWLFHTPTGCARTRQGLAAAQERSQRLLEAGA